MENRLRSAAAGTFTAERKMPSALRSNIDELGALLNTVVALDPQVTAAARSIASALLGGKKILACGNGGSASDASHLTTEFVSRFNRERRPYPAISLATHGGDLTAIGNDYEFCEVFARQVGAFGQRGDVLIAFTTSGQSENVRRALLRAKELGLSAVAFLGKDGGQARGIAEIDLLIPSVVTARVQECHKLIMHTICELVEELLQQDEYSRHAGKS
jgi:phosphoheptose isomerase